MTAPTTGFSPHNLHLLLKRVDIVSSASNRVHYQFSDLHGNTAGQIAWSGGQWQIEIDNFPGQKKYFITDFPIKSTNEFIHEMSRIGISFELNSPIN